ncbi:Cupredoxin [Chaetomium strumarium]|uniref:Cupredoxin n=1 Tax=Chaetomium strumarium TaxID=1170767 RepID=A0AAJ0GRT4_9PEZI|nr:Cupredoxin [Chaetomium strumarium]
MQLTTLVLATLTSLASAQKTWVVAVAKNGSLTYSPDKLTAQPGEQIQFQFHAGNHTVTQSTFDQPCQPVGMHSNITGFHSGFLPAAASASTGMMPTFTITINDTKPLWLYCAQGKHCENGMVMVINEPTTNASRTLEKYKELAAKGTTVVPGAEGAGSGGTTGSTDGSTTTGDASSATPTTAGAGMLSAPGTIALVAAAAAAFFL